MSFKEFVQSHTGRRFFDSFGRYIDLFEKFVEVLAQMNNTMAAAQAAQQSALESVTPMIPAIMPCIECEELVPVETSIALTYQGTTAVMCVDCAKEKDLLHDRLPLN